MHGFGTKQSGQGYKLIGTFVNGLPHGFAKLFQDDRLVFEGEYQSGKKEGWARKYYSNGKVMFEGELKNGKWTGLGRKFYEDGRVWYEGLCLNNVPTGFGKYYH